MLLKYSVENFKSIKNKIELNMEAVGISEFADSINISQSGDKYLPLSIIYGPNGGGKSNILESLFSIRNKIVIPIAKAIDDDLKLDVSNIRITPYKFNNENSSLPIKFELIFSNKLGEYKYNISFIENIVLEEKLELVKFSTNKKNLLFFREKEEIKLGEEFLKLKVSDDISKELPVLSYLGFTYKSNPIIADVVDWFKLKIAIINYANPKVMNGLYLSSEEKTKKLILDFINEMDIDIKDYRIDKQANKIYTKHYVNGGNSEIELFDESSGSRKLLNLAPMMLESLFNGTTLIIDELDAYLHPQILKHIIELYSNKKSNKHNAQLIFTSHDMTTMTNELLRRDEIWFAAKGREEDTQLYSLVEFKERDTSIRKDAKYNKQYLEGRYGADPYFRKIINWEINE